MTANHTLSMYAYHTWANTILFDHLKQLPAGTCNKQIKSVFPSVFEVLMHIYIVDCGWLSLVLKEYHSDDYETIIRTINRLKEETKDNSLDELAHKQQLLALKVNTFIRNNDMSHSEMFSGAPMTYEQVINHIVNHGTYHRGNVTAMLHQLDYKGVPTDYAAYLYQLNQ